MKPSRFVSSLALLSFFLCTLADAKASCCSDAKKVKKPCAHECCIKAAKAKKSCLKCNPKTKPSIKAAATKS